MTDRTKRRIELIIWIAVGVINLIHGDISRLVYGLTLLALVIHLTE